MVWQTAQLPRFRIFKDGEAADGSGRKRLLVAAVLILIKRRVAAEQRPFEAGQRLLNEREGYGSRPERPGKLGLIGRIAANLGNRNVVRLIHLHRVGNRKGGLRLELGSATIPELKRRVGRIQQGWSVAHADHSADPMRNRASIGETDVWIMAGGAGQSIVFGQPRVVEELAAQGDRFHGWRVVRGNRHRRQPQGGLDIDNLTDWLFIRRGSTSNAEDQEPG